MFHCYSSPSKHSRRHRRTSSLLSLVHTRSSYSVVLALGLSSARDLQDRRQKKKMLFKYHSVEDQEIDIRDEGQNFLRRLSADISDISMMWRSLPEIDLPTPLSLSDQNEPIHCPSANTISCDSNSLLDQVLSPGLKTDDVAQKQKKVQDDVIMADLDSQTAKSRKRKRRRQDKLLCCMRAADDE